VKPFFALFSLTALAIASAAAAPVDDLAKLDRHMAVKSVSTQGVTWHDPARPPFRIGGLNWFGRNGLYRRLPVMKGIPEPVDKLADCTTAATIAFRTDSNRVLVELHHATPYAGHWHMSPVGRSGIDLYEGGPGKWRTVGVSRFKNDRTALFKSPGKREMREFMINLPIYNGVRSIRIGLDDGAALLPPSPYASPKRIVAYGGSVMQGACASRPGRAFMNIIGRHFNLEVVNLGFSGSSRFEPIMAELTAEVENPAVVIVEGDRNAGWKRVRDLEPNFITTIRKKHPGVPIVVMQGNPWWGADPNRAKIMAEQRAFVEKMQKSDADLYWWDCTDFIGPDHAECLIDGKHPTDLGFQRMSDHMIPLLDALLKKYRVTE
jgi:hypothetical protein